MKNTVSGVVICLTLLSCFVFQGCSMTADIYTNSGMLRRPEIPIKTDLAELSAQSFSQNSITELKAELVDNVNLQLLYTLVKSENPYLLQKIAEVHVAEGNKTQAGTLENPEIRAYAGKLPLTSKNSMNESSFGLRILQPVDISGGIAAGKHIAHAEHIRASWNLVDAEQKIKILTSQVFLEYWIQTQILKFQETLKSARKKQFEIIRNEVNSGRSTKVRLVEFNRFFTDAELAYEDEVLKLEVTKNNMKRLIGDFSLIFGAPQFPDNLKIADFKNIDRTAWVKTHPEYLAATQQISVKEAEQLKSNGQHLKKLKVGLGYEFENDGDNHWLNFLVEIPFPLWDFGIGSKYAAKAKVFIAQKQAENVLIRLHDEIENALFTLKTLSSKYNSINMFLKEKRSLHQDIVKGQASVTTLFEVLESQAELMDYEIKALRIKLALLKTFFYLNISLKNKFPEMR